MNSGESLKRKFLMERAILPFSIRNVPSRVSPVYMSVRASSGRRYHSRVTSTPRVVLAIIDSMVSLPLAMRSDCAPPVAVLPCLLAQNRLYAS